MARRPARNAQAATFDLVTRVWLCWILILGLLITASSGARRDQSTLLHRVSALPWFSPPLAAADEAKREDNLTAPPAPPVSLARIGTSMIEGASPRPPAARPCAPGARARCTALMLLPRRLAGAAIRAAQRRGRRRPAAGPGRPAGSSR